MPQIDRRALLAIVGTAGATGLLGATPVHAANRPKREKTPHVDEKKLNALDSNLKRMTASALMSVNSFVAANLHQYIDVDGAYGAQCWDLWERYSRDVVGIAGISTQYSAHPGYAIGIWDGYTQNGAAPFYNQISASAIPNKGDVAIWNWGIWPHDYSHIAIVMEDRGSNVLIFEQNGYPLTSCEVQQTTKNGLAGYLRPKLLTSPTTPYADTIAVQANTGELWKATVAGGTPLGFGMMKGTSPSIARLANGQEVYAFQANTGSLWTVGPDGVTDHQFGMMPGTSPSITAVPGGGYRIAAQANTAQLWTFGPEGVRNTELGMMPGTSPAIATLENGSMAMAFQANTGSLWTVAQDGTKDWSLGMMAGASPAIATIGNNYQAAVQANTGSLFTVGHFGSKDWSLGMMNGSNPSVTTLSDGRWIAAVQANTGSLMSVGSAGPFDHRLGMMPGTSPAVSAQANGGYQIAFQANTGSLLSSGSLGDRDYILGMMAGTSPSFGR